MACGKHRRWHFQDPKFENFVGIMPLEPQDMGRLWRSYFSSRANITLCPWHQVSYRL